MKRLLPVMAVGLLTVGCAESPPAPPALTDDQLKEGVYSTPREIQDFTGTTLELKAGKFRYWFYTDVINPKHPEPDYPLSGEYFFKDGILLLKSNEMIPRDWYFEVLKGRPVLWNDAGHHLWKTKQDIFPYGILIWTAKEMPKEGVDELKRPEVIPFYTEEQQKKIRETMSPLMEQN